MSPRAYIRRLRHDQQGATAIEFSIVAFVFFMLMFGIIEYGMIMLTEVAIESATQQVSRSASIGSVTTPGCPDRVCEIKALVAKKTAGLVRKESVVVTSTVVSGATAAAPPVPDICIDDVRDPYPAACITYEDNDGTPGYQKTGGVDGTSIGKAGDLVEIRVTYLWRVLFPMFRSHFGTNGVLTISSSTVIKNEPF